MLAGDSKHSLFSAQMCCMNSDFFLNLHCRCKWKEIVDIFKMSDVSSLVAVKPRQIFNTADIISPSHRGRGATAVFVRHKPQWYRHDRRGSAEVPSLIAVVPRKTINIANLRGGTSATLNMFKTSAVPPPVGPIRSGIAETPSLPPRHRYDRRGTVQGPQ